MIHCIKPLIRIHIKKQKQKRNSLKQNFTFKKHLFESTAQYVLLDYNFTVQQW